ncbi:MAG: hypothetical protein P0Y55_12015 [Candidatus Cohnella colombiensis]|uniref:Uncharacterized protein n=1 Tax=Candidatus Cohnella colombiensis TaxID=3121368 RepID=A0AA95EV40_9BACL|nr:MAG: hypothetical protein P0Y55_12015 [Cohnella sp.]
MQATQFPMQPSDNALASYFGWAGSSFPFAGETDVVISSNTTWSDVAGFRKIRKLTINAGIVLTIARSPFSIFADEIVFGSTTSQIKGDGPSGAASGNHSSNYARGATRETGNLATRAQAGCGGIMLFVVARKFSGAAGVISANGGAGYFGTVAATGSGNANNQGQGALSSFRSSGLAVQEVYDGSASASSTSGINYLHPLGRLLSDGGGGGGASGIGGGSGGVNNSSNISGGGSGIGGGGGAYISGNNTLPGGQNITLSPNLLIELANFGCLGGGGGGVAYTLNSSSTANGEAAGGGGGSVCVWGREFAVTPVLQANGGLSSSSPASGLAAQSNGGAGTTHLITV